MYRSSSVTILRHPWKTVSDNFVHNNRLQGLYRILIRNKGDSEVCCLVMEPAPGSGKFVAWWLSVVTIAFVPNSVFDGRLHAHQGVSWKRGSLQVLFIWIWSAQSPLFVYSTCLSAKNHSKGAFGFDSEESRCRDVFERRVLGRLHQKCLHTNSNPPNKNGLVFRTQCADPVFVYTCARLIVLLVCDVSTYMLTL